MFTCRSLGDVGKLIWIRTISKCWTPPSGTDPTTLLSALCARGLSFTGWSDARAVLRVQHIFQRGADWFCRSSYRFTNSWTKFDSNHEWFIFDPSCLHHLTLGSHQFCEPGQPGSMQELVNSSPGKATQIQKAEKKQRLKKQF